MPLSERQLAAFADKHAWQIPFDTGPRYLAGPGDARHVTHGLAAAGWNTVSDPLSAEIVLRSPDLRLSLQFDPQSATGAWWRLRSEPFADGPAWYAEFGELVPAEILAALTDALISAPSQPADPWAPVTSAGWTRDSESTARSPDSMCRIEQQQMRESQELPSWHIETSEPRGEFSGPRIWHAYLDERTPPHLVAPFLTALADPSPLQRGMYERTAHYRAVQKPSPLLPQQVVDAHTERVNSLRAHSRSARQQQANTTAPPTKTNSTRPAVRR
ncbi:DUF317 domain-containing protein [Streptomyces sp. CS7]|uniref:DUF317 domain-containing protein n=1 Tax=Streptomyces sp. CS-7 TaxID=2906769 RepID=UPI0021B44730|nr:DUF317 domain-containing protein [Streptomyces sp. CS-7]MCT6780461.1 DUF317 domain-containing protein [Streptomyces sp. CS-7]